jgi:2-hydroxy-3-oxopropionate reductase
VTVVIVGFVGLGLMGTGMARNLLRAGHDVVVWNRSPDPVQGLVADGARAVDNPAALGRCSVVAMCLPNGAVVESVLFGDDGVLSDPMSTAVTVIDHSTIAAADARRLADRCDVSGHAFLDAPVSGGPQGAEAGTLAVMVGGDPKALDEVRPLLSAYSSSIVHMGGPGAGQTAKLVNQICIALTVQGLGEGFRIGLANGLDPDALYQVLRTATADSVMLRTRVPVAGLQTGMPASNGWAPGFSAAFMLKDLDFALAAAADSGVELPGVRHVRDSLATLVDGGGGDLDWTRIAVAEDLS